MIDSMVIMNDILWLSILVTFFVIYMILYINFSYFWHVITETGFKLAYIFAGIKIIRKGFQKRPVSNNKSSFKQSNQKLWLIISFRYLFLIILLSIMFFNMLSVSELDIEIFLALLMLLAFITFLYEIESKNINPGYGKLYYGGSYAIYEFLAFIIIYLWIVSGNYWNFNDFRINPWSLNILNRIYQTLLVVILIYCIARSSDYLGFKRHSRYEDVPKFSFEMPIKLSTLQSLSQLIFQSIILFFISIITTEQTYKFIFGSEIVLWLYVLIFIFLLMFYSLISLFFSSVTYRIKSSLTSIYISLLAYFISLIAVLLYLLALII